MARSVSSTSRGVPLLSPLRRSELRDRVSDQIFAQIAGAIRDLRLPPGYVVSETDLAGWLGVSRTPVREAISRLAERGLVEVVPQVGTKVARIDLFEVREAQFIREHLEVASYLAVCGHPEVDLSELQTALIDQHAAQLEDDNEAFCEADEAFHSAIFRASGHGGVWDTVQGAKFQLDRIRRLANEPSQVRSQMIAEHSAIHAALLARDPSGSEVVSKHTRRVLDYAPRLSDKYQDYFQD